MTLSVKGVAIAFVCFLAFTYIVKRVPFLANLTA